MILLIMAGALAAAVSVDIAPDQPVPHVFDDEPLVVEVASPEDVTATVTASFERPGHDPHVVEFGTLRLRRNGPQWLEWHDPTIPLGDYTATVTLDTGGEAVATHDVFTMIRRPVAAASAPIVADLRHGDVTTALALADVPVRLARIDPALPEFANLVRACTSAGVAVSVAVTRDPRGENDPDTAVSNAGMEAFAEALAQQYAKVVAQWELPGQDVDALMRAVAAIRRSGSRVPVLATVESVDDVDRVLRQGAGKVIAGLALRLDAPDAAQLRALRHAAERHGYERLPVYYVGPLNDGEENEYGPERLHALFALRTAVNTDPLFPTEWIYYNASIQPAYAYLSGMAHRLASAAYVGRIESEEPVTLHVFRRGATWIVAAWSQSATTHVIDAEDSQQLQFTDGLGNPLDLARDADTITMSLDEAPVYLSGTGGTILARAASATAAREADAMLSAADGAHPLAAHESILKSIAAGKASTVDRLQFVGLLQAFPDIERQWHSGALGRAQAVPAVASLAHMVRMLCILEQEEGEEFVESLQNTVARCGEYQSIYLMGTGANGADHERGDWLLEEVNRLVAEAESLRNAGRVIEAIGVASLAEARARALEHAATAKPLSQPEPDHVPKPDESGQVTTE